MSKIKDEEKRWEEFERELAEAIAKDKSATRQERQAWLDTLPEHVPPPEGNGIKVIFFDGGKYPASKKKTDLAGRDKKRKQVKAD